MNNGLLEHNETTLSPERIKEFLSKIVKGTITPEDVEFIFVSMSEEGQDNFLGSLKELLSEKDWKNLVVHLKSYDYKMMGEFRPKTRKIKEDMAIAVYDHFNNI